MPPGSTRPRGRPRTLSAAEALLWDHLRERRLEGWRFLRRPGDSTCAATFFCPDANVTVVVDADSGPVSFTSLEVLAATEAVLQAILLALRTALARRHAN
jgi:hypothetical protein